MHFLTKIVIAGLDYLPIFHLFLLVYLSLSVSVLLSLPLLISLSLFLPLTLFLYFLFLSLSLSLHLLFSYPLSSPPSYLVSTHAYSSLSPFVLLSFYSSNSPHLIDKEDSSYVRLLRRQKTIPTMQADLLIVPKSICYSHHCFFCYYHF